MHNGFRQQARSKSKSLRFLANVSSEQANASKKAMLDGLGRKYECKVLPREKLQKEHKLEGLPRGPSDYKSEPKTKGESRLRSLKTKPDWSQRQRVLQSVKKVVNCKRL